MRKEPYLYLAAFLMDGSIAGVLLCAPLLAVALGASYDDLGMIGALGFLAYSLSCLGSGRLSERVGYRRSMAFAALATGASAALFCYASRLAHVFILYGTTWLFLSGFWPPFQAWLGEGKSRGDLLRSLGRFNVSWSSGVLIGPAFGGALYAVGAAWPFGVCAAVVCAISLSLFLLRFRESTPPEGPVSCSPHPLSARFLTIARVANFATFFGTGTIRSLFPKLALDLGIAPPSLGIVMAMLGLSELCSFYLVSHTARWQFRLFPFVVVQTLGVAGMLTLALGNSALMLAIGLLGPGVLIGLTFTSSIFYGLSAVGPGGRRAGLHESITGAGFLVGPLVGGFAAEHLGPRAPYLLAAGVIVCALGIETYLHRRGGPPASAPERQDMRV